MSRSFSCTRCCSTRLLSLEMAYALQVALGDVRRKPQHRHDAKAGVVVADGREGEPSVCTMAAWLSMKTTAATTYKACAPAPFSAPSILRE